MTEIEKLARELYDKFFDCPKPDEKDREFWMRRFKCLADWILQNFRCKDKDEVVDNDIPKPKCFENRDVKNKGIILTCSWCLYYKKGCEGIKDEEIYEYGRDKGG